MILLYDPAPGHSMVVQEIWGQGEQLGLGDVPFYMSH